MTDGDYPLTPHMVMAYGPQEDFAALDLSRASLDLTDRDIGGRSAPSQIDGFVYLGRGIYRPGETAHVTALLRDAAGRAIDSRPVTVTVHRPNYTEAYTERFESLDVGGLSFKYDIPASAPRGACALMSKRTVLSRLSEPNRSRLKILCRSVSKLRSTWMRSRPYVPRRP